MKRLLLSIFALLFGINSYAMDAPMENVGTKRPASELESEPEAQATQEERIEYKGTPQERKQRIEATVQELQSKASLGMLPEELKQHIFGFLEAAKGFGREKLYNAARNIRSFLMSTKGLSAHLADPSFNGLLINEMAKRYNTNPVAVAIALHTKGAQEWLMNNSVSTPHILLTRYLISALKEKDIDVADWLKKIIDSTGLDAEYHDEDGMNILMAAAYANDIPLLQKVIHVITSWNDEGQEEQVLDQINKDNENALYLAARNGNVEAMQLLIDAGIKISWWDDSGYNSPLDPAIQSGNLAAVELLLNPYALQRIDYEIKDIGTPLQIAAIEKKPEIVKRLLKIPGIDLSGALFDAIPDLELMQLLIDNGAEVNEVGQENPLIGAIEDSKLDDATTKEVVNFLIANEGRVNEPNQQGITPLNTAAKKGKIQTLRLLLKNEADVFALDEAGLTALDYAKELKSPIKDQIIGILEEAQKKQEAKK